MEKLDLIKIGIEAAFAIVAFSVSLNIRFLISKLKEIEIDLLNLKLKLVEIEAELKNLNKIVDKNGL